MGPGNWPLQLAIMSRLRLALVRMGTKWTLMDLGCDETGPLEAWLLRLG